MTLPSAFTRSYVAFEGPLGAGKTTLATLLAGRARSSLVLEDPDGNEFLADFYRDRKRWALPMQLWFLTARHDQLSRVPRSPHTATVADYSYGKDEVFARLLLDGRELRLYQTIGATLAGTLRQPDVIVYLDADDEVLLERIRLRGRRYEDPIDTAYLDSVRKAYEQSMMTGTSLPIVRYDTSALDLSSEDQLADLFDRIAGGLRRKRQTT